jgi:hypothetical protein
VGIFLKENNERHSTKILVDSNGSHKFHLYDMVFT